MTHTQNLCSAMNPSKVHTHTHTAVNTHTHTVNTHTHGAVGSHLCCGTQGAVGGSVPCSRAPRRGIEGGENAVHSLPPSTIPAGPETQTPTLTIRPRLPQANSILEWKLLVKYIQVYKILANIILAWITINNTILAIIILANNITLNINNVIQNGTNRQ